MQVVRVYVLYNFNFISIINKCVLINTLFKSIDKDCLLDQTQVSLLKLLLDPSVHFLVKSRFSKNPAKSVYPEAPALDYLITLNI